MMTRKNILFLILILDSDKDIENIVQRYGIPAEGVRRMLSAKPLAMTLFLKSLREQFISPRNYMVKECGFSDKELDILRARMIDYPCSKILETWGTTSPEPTSKL